MDKNRQILIIYIFLTVITLSAYRQVGQHEFIYLDDSAYVFENYHVQGGITWNGIRWALTTYYAANWHPLTWVSHMLDVQIFGLNPHWHHLTNLLFHIANVLLLFFALHRMTLAHWRSAFVAAVFALHPLHVESVAWVAERKDVLSTFFWMLTLVAYGWYAARPGLKNYLAVIVFFALGLAAKPMLVTLPFVLLLLDYWPLQRTLESEPVHPIPKGVNSSVPAHRKKGKTAKHAAKTAVTIPTPAKHSFRKTLIRPLVFEKLPLFAISILSCIATYRAQNSGRAIIPIEICPPGIRVANALVSYVVYIKKMIWPENLAVFYPHPGSPPFWQVLGTLLLLAAATLVVCLAARKYPYMPVGWLWFTGTLVPVIGLVQVGAQAVADRYTYIPSIGLSIMAAWGIPELLRKRRYGKELLVVSSALCLLCLFVLTRQQLGYWRDGVSLFDHALNVTDKNYFAYNCRGRTYSFLGDPARAIADYDRAIQISPESAPAYNNRGNSRDCLGDHAGALEDFNRAIEINPEYADAYNNRGATYEGMSNHIRAIEDFDKAIAINPVYKEAYYNRGSVQASLGNEKQAFEDMKKAARLGCEDAGNFLKERRLDW